MVGALKAVAARELRNSESASFCDGRLSEVDGAGGSGQKQGAEGHGLEKEEDSGAVEPCDVCIVSICVCDMYKHSILAHNTQRIIRLIRVLVIYHSFH